MGQCNETVVLDGLTPEQCPNEAVLYGKCEAHLTDRERAVLELVRAGMDILYPVNQTECRLLDRCQQRLRSAIAAVKEQP